MRVHHHDFLLVFTPMPHSHIVPFSKSQIEELLTEHSSPVYLYDTPAIRARAQQLAAAFDWMPDYRNYFAVKALPNPYILKLLAAEGMGADCSSLGELITAERVGLRGEQIMFTSNDTPAEDFQKAHELGAIVNFDDLSHIDFYQQTVGALPTIACCRYNPGDLKAGNDIIGNPHDAKYGFTREQLVEGYRQLRDAGVTRFGLHTMVASNERDPAYHIETAQILFDVIADLHKELGITFEFINLGGGFGIPYEPGHSPLDPAVVAAGIREAYEAFIQSSGHHPSLRIVSEHGRWITGPCGYLVTHVLHIKQTFKTHIGVDASMSNLMRPGMYGAYHHITVLGKEDAERTQTCDVVGSLCENNDKFAIDRTLPSIDIGDVLVIHDAGAHAHAMGFQYNAKLRSAELLIEADGSYQQIRRAETLDDYFSTIDFSSL